VDFNVYLRVLRRFWYVVAAGVVVATLFAVLMFSRSAPPEWVSASTIFVTEDGFPWGRAVLDEVIEVEGVNDPEAPTSYIPRYGDAGRFSGLAQLYAALAQSDEVRQAVLSAAPSGSRYESEVVRAADNTTALPFVRLNGYGSSAEDAQTVASLAMDSLRSYVMAEQERANIPPDERVQLLVSSRAIPAEVVEGRSVARPIAVFIAVLAAFVALAFVLENVRPRVRRVSSRPRAVRSVAKR
jgi:hypothetical protein